MKIGRSGQPVQKEGGRAWTWVSAAAIAGANFQTDPDLTCVGSLVTHAALHLGSLGHWGGPTETVPLLGNSVAIDPPGAANTQTVDQRGIPRPASWGDAGAYERTTGTHVEIYGPADSTGTPEAMKKSLTESAGRGGAGGRGGRGGGGGFGWFGNDVFQPFHQNQPQRRAVQIVGAFGVERRQAAGAAAATETFRLPSDETLRQAAKLGIVEDRPIMMDYWTASLDKKALIGVRENGEKLLVKSQDEYTSPIQKIYKTGDDYIIMTENSIYLVSTSITTRKIS